MARGRRRALMLSRDDAQIQAIFDAARLRRRDVDAKMEALAKEQQELINDYNAAVEADVAKIAARVDELGIVIMGRDKHKINFNSEEGVVWLEVIEDCDCPFCALGSLFGGGRR